MGFLLNEPSRRGANGDHDGAIKSSASGRLFLTYCNNSD